MRFIKMTSLAAVAAVAAMAFIEASSASAVSLCKSNHEGGECPAGEVYAIGTTLKAGLKAGTAAMLETNLGTVKCKKSPVEGKTTGSTEATLTGEITETKFEECTLGLTQCEVTVEHKPFLALLLLSGVPNPLYHLIIEEKSLGKPRAQVVCGSSLNCTFGHPAILFNVTGGAPAILGVAQELEKEAGGILCPNTSTWKAEYEVTEPNPLWPAMKP